MADAPLAPVAAVAVPAASTANFRAVTQRVQCLVNGIALANITNTRLIFGAVKGTKWIGALALHHEDLVMGAWLLAIGVHALATIEATPRGDASDQVPPLNALFVLYYVQATIRYRLDERLTEVEIDLAAGLARITEPTAATANAAARLQAAGFTNAAGTGNPAVEPAGGDHAGKIIIRMAPDAATLESINTFVRESTLDTLSTEAMALIALELAASGHHRLATNDSINKLIEKSVTNWAPVAAFDTIIPVKTCAVDLGCDVSYRGTCSRTQLKKRLTKAKTRLKTIQKKRLPFKFRRTAAKLTGQGAAMYATELVYIVPSTWHQLRKATAEAINLSKGGSSSYISVAAMDPTLDPQFRGILRRIKFWRKFLDLFPMYHSWFLEKIACAAPKKYTLTGAFRKSLLDIGWTCMANGNMVHSSGLTVSWLNASIPFLKKMLIKVWGSVMLAQIQHRKHVDITGCDLDAQSKVFKKLDCQKQGLLLTYCSGKHITGDFLCKFAGGSDCCPFCQEKDGRWHRIHDCACLSDLRKEYTATIRWLARQPVAIAHYDCAQKTMCFY